MKSIHEQGEIFQCKVCDKKFNLLGNLTKHMQYKHEGKKYPCKLCTKVYTQAHNLRSHMATFHTSMRYRCKWCVGESHKFKILSGFRIC